MSLTGLMLIYALSLKGSRITSIMERKQGPRYGEGRRLQWKRSLMYGNYQKAKKREGRASESEPELQPDAEPEPTRDLEKRGRKP
jgi:hypothetical protein